MGVVCGREESVDVLEREGYVGMVCGKGRVCCVERDVV